MSLDWALLTISPKLSPPDGSSWVGLLYYYFCLVFARSHGFNKKLGRETKKKQGQAFNNTPEWNWMEKFNRASSLKYVHRARQERQTFHFRFEPRWKFFLAAVWKFSFWNKNRCCDAVTWLLCVVFIINNQRVVFVQNFTSLNCVKDK